MKLKYYLRGLGVGIICTAILMGIALSGNKKEKLTDTEIIERARLLGMVMAEEAQDEGSQDAEGQSASAKGQEAGSKGADGQAKDANSQGADGQEKDAGSEGSDSQGADGQEKGAGSKESDSQGTGSQAKDTSSEGSDSQGADSQEKDTGSKGQEGGSQSQGASGNQNAANKGMVEFEISERDHSEDVSRKLFEAGLIKDASSFNQYMTSEGMDEHLQTGKYQIPAGATEDEILEMIVRLP